MSKAGGSSQFLWQLWTVFLKELRQTIRDERVLFVLFYAPAMMTFVLGFAVNYDLADIPSTVVDMDRSPASTAHLRRLFADGTLALANRANSGEVAERLLDEGKTSLAVIVPLRYGADLSAGRGARIQLILDGSDPNRAIGAASAAMRFFGHVSGEIIGARRNEASLPPLALPSLSARIYYNPRLKTAVNIVPGVAAMLLFMTTAVATAMGLTREKDTGTLEQVMITPIAPSAFLLGKLLPFLAIGLLEVLALLAIGSWVFEVPMVGSLFICAVAVVLYLFCTLGSGILISTYSETQQQALLASFLFIMPMVLLSGIMTPVLAMPRPVQIATELNPLRLFGEIMRSVLLRGAGLRELAPQFGGLAAIGSVQMLVATRRFGRSYIPRP